MNRVHEIFHWWSICALSPFPVSSPVSESLHSSFPTWCSLLGCFISGRLESVVFVLWWSDGILHMGVLSARRNGIFLLVWWCHCFHFPYWWIRRRLGAWRLYRCLCLLGLVGPLLHNLKWVLPPRLQLPLLMSTPQFSVFLTSCSSSCTAFSISCMAQSMADSLNVPWSDLSVVLSSLLVYFCLLWFVINPIFVHILFGSIGHLLLWLLG